jgi:U3 small nucleolar RNA-associated protein 3
VQAVFKFTCGHLVLDGWLCGGREEQREKITSSDDPRGWWWRSAAWLARRSPATSRGRDLEKVEAKSGFEGDGRLLLIPTYTIQQIMAKKRKGSARDVEEPKGPNMDVGESRKRIRTYEDVADSDDEFHLNNDKVLLEERPDVKRRRKQQEDEEFLEQSDEEVLDAPDSDDEEFESAEEGQDAVSQSGDEGAQDEEEDDEVWGTSKEALYGADAIETEEQALEEEAEALRLQKKQLQAMSAADYGFDESEWQADAEAEKAKDMATAERLKLLKSRYPEFEPLSKELLELREVHTQLLEAAKEATATALPYVPNAVTKLRAASAYIGTLTMYFALLTSTASFGGDKVAALSPNQLRDHPVMESLVQCRDLWLRVSLLPEDPSPAEIQEAFASDDEDMDESIEELETIAKPNRKQRKALARAQAAGGEAAQKRKAERLQRAEAGFADLDALVGATSTKRTKKLPRAQDDDSDLGEEAPLTAAEAAEKAKRKKSLRFYTSQIAQKANKRGAAGRDAGGDEDVPHRERLRDRQARLNAEAEKRGRKPGGDGENADLGGNSDDEDADQARHIRETADDDVNGYYDMVASKTARKKSDKAAYAEAQKQAALLGGEVVQQETVGEDGKRQISYLIEKNKGLTPHRKKENRNPRVKKRLKYEDKKKKLASMKPIYKGGEGRGGYGGEMTGIKKGLVKSTKL